MREAAFAHWPGMLPAASRTATTFSSLDVLPTLLAIAGASLPTDRPYDGVDMSRVLLHGGDTAHSTASAPPSPRDFLFLYGGAAGLKLPSAARFGPYKAHWATGPGLSGCKASPSAPAGCPTLFYTGGPLLFNVEVDPSEAYNLTDGKTMPAADSPLRAVVETLNKARAAEIATVHQVHTPPAPDGPGEGPGTYGVCCDRKRACNCST